MNKKFIRLFSLAIAAVMVFSLCACGSTSEPTEETTTKLASEVPEGKAEVVARFNKLMADTKNAKSINQDKKNGYEEMKYWLDQGVGGIDCENETVSSLFMLFGDKSVSNGYDLSTNNEENPSTPKDCFPVMGSDAAAVLDLADVRSAIITSNDGDTHYTIIIKINPETNPEEGESVYGKLYGIPEDEEILAEFAKYDKYFTVSEDGYNATYGVGTIKMIVDKQTDHVTKLELSRNVVVETSITGQGDFAEEIGADVAVKFDYNSTANYEILWPATEE